MSAFSDTSTASVTVISVCYNSSGVLPDMLSSVPEDVPVILVDNGSDDLEDLRKLATKFGATVIAHGENRGFGVGCNTGAAQATTELLLFLNPDAMLAQGALEKLLEGVARHPEAAAFNPVLTFEGGRKLLKRSSVLLPRHEWPERAVPSSDREVPVLSGAAFLVRRAAFEKVQGFDPEIFLYHEDDDLSLRLKETCGPLILIPDAEVSHSGGGSSPRSPQVAALKAWHMGKSRLYAARKHKLPWAFERALATATLQLLSPELLFSRRKRAKQWSFWQAVWSGR